MKKILNVKIEVETEKYSSGYLLKCIESKMNQINENIRIGRTHEGAKGNNAGVQIQYQYTITEE